MQKIYHPIEIHLTKIQQNQNESVRGLPGLCFFRVGIFRIKCRQTRYRIVVQSNSVITNSQGPTEFFRYNRKTL
jgi:hypothetical protein